MTRPDTTVMRDRDGATIPAWATGGLILAISIGALLRLIWAADIEYKGDELWTFEQVRAVLSGAP